MVMISHRLDRQIDAIEAIVAAVKAGDISEFRLDEACQRVRGLKRRRLGTAVHTSPSWPDVIEQTASLQRALSQNAVTALRLTGSILPESGQVAVLADEWAPRMAAAGREGVDPVLADALHEVLPQVTVQTYAFPTALERLDEETLVERLRQCDAVVIGINGSRNARYLAFIQTLASRTKIPMTAFLLRSPYDARYAPASANLWALYENTPWMAQAGVRAACGLSAAGRLPVAISADFPRDFRAPSVV